MQLAASGIQIVTKWRLCTELAASTCKISMRLAANRIRTRVASSLMQIVAVWPPVACKMKKIAGNLPASGGHAGTICMRLKATLVRMRLAASRMLILHALAASSVQSRLYLQARCENNNLN
jgi:hypothetical protein